MKSLDTRHLKGKIAMNPHQFQELMEKRKVRNAVFVACNYSKPSKRPGSEAENTFVLFFDFVDSASEAEFSQGYLINTRNDHVKTFKTPQALMSGARNLGIKKYVVDATDWTASHYNLYKMQVKARGGSAK